VFWDPSAEAAAVKLRIGFGPFAENLARFAALRATLPAARRSVDANGAWPVAEAPGRLAALAAHGLHHAEQPVPAGGHGTPRLLRPPLGRPARDVAPPAARGGRRRLPRNVRPPATTPG